MKNISETFRDTSRPVLPADSYLLFILISIATKTIISYSKDLQNFENSRHIFSTNSRSCTCTVDKEVCSSAKERTHNQHIRTKLFGHNVKQILIDQFIMTY